MEEQQALIRMIAANPDDDTPRLIYADWLDESGTELNRQRAEFIRFDVRFHSLPPGSPERQELRDEKFARMMPLANAWRDELPRITGLTWGWFERGFVEHVTTFYDTFVEHRETIFNAAPIVSICLNGIVETQVETLCNQPWMERILRLQLHLEQTWTISPLNPTGLTMISQLADQLITAPYLSRLQKLTLRPDFDLPRDLVDKLQKRFGPIGQ